MPPTVYRASYLTEPYFVVLEEEHMNDSKPS